jgi:hypothetical protein
LVYPGNNTLFLLGGHDTAGVSNLRLNVLATARRSMLAFMLLTSPTSRSALRLILAT